MKWLKKMIWDIFQKKKMTEICELLNVGDKGIYENVWRGIFIITCTFNKRL